MKNHKEILRQKVLKHGWIDVAEMVGGFDILYKHAFNNDYNEFLNLFNDLEVVQSEEDPNYTLYRFGPSKNMMVYNRKNDDVYINYEIIWSFFSEGIGFEFDETQDIMKRWLGEVYNLRGITTTKPKNEVPNTLGEVYNLRGITTNSWYDKFIK